MCINKYYQILNPQELYNLLVKEKYENDFKKFSEYLNRNYPLLFGKGPFESEISPNGYISSKKFWIEFSELDSDFLYQPDSSKLPHLQPQYEAFLRKCGWKTSHSEKDLKEFNNENDMGRPYIRICIKPINKLDTFE